MSSSTTAAAAPIKDDNNNKVDSIGGGGGQEVHHHHPTFIMPVLTLDKIQYIIDTIEKETKRETNLVKYILYSGWSTYTNDPINLLVNSRNPGQGKTHPILAVLSYFPEDDYIILTGSSDKALYHEKGKLVVKDEETGAWIDIQPQLVALEAKKAEVENEYSTKEKLNKAERAERDQILGEIKKQISELKSKASKLINLEHKMLVFLDTPNATLLEALMPLLSHDSYHSKYKFTDKKGGSLEASDNILWGWPTVIFAQTLDISYRKRWPELSRRFIVINPNVSRQKVSDAVDLAIDSASLPDLLYQDEVVSDADINRAKNMVKEIKYELLEFSKNLRKPNGEYDKKKSAVFVPFSQSLKASLPKSGDMNDVTNAKRFLRFQTLSTITQINRRPIIKVTPHIKEDGANNDSNGQQQPLKVIEIPIVVFADTEKAIELMADAVNTGLRPEQRQWYEEVFLPTYEAKEENDWKYDPASKKRSKDENDWIKLYEDVKAVKVEELVKATKKYRNEVISPRDVREKYLDPLYNNGLVDKANSTIDRRRDIFYPVVALFEEGDGETASSEVVDGARGEEKSKKLEQKAYRSNFLEGSKLHLPDFTSFPREDVIKSRIQRVIEKYNEKGFTATLFDGQENKAELDDIIQIYFSKDQAERVFEVLDVNNITSAPAVATTKAEEEEGKEIVEEQDRKKDDDAYAQGCSSYYSEQSENRDGLQELEQKNVRPIDPQELDSRKLEQKPVRSNFSCSSESRQQQPSPTDAAVTIGSFLEKNPASELKTHTKTSNQRLGAIGEILKTMEHVTREGRPHSVGVVYAVAPSDQPFCLYLITRPVLKKARNIHDNPNVSFVVPFPHYLFRSIPPRCIQFQGKVEALPIDDPLVIKAFQSSIVLKRSMEHSLRLGESIFVRIVPDKKIFCFGIGASLLKFLIASQNRNLGNYYVVVPENRRRIEKG